MGLLDVSAKVDVETSRVVVTMDKRARNPYPVAPATLLVRKPILELLDCSGIVLPSRNLRVVAG